MVRLLLPLLVFVTLGLVFYIGLKDETPLDHIPSPLIGKPSPQFDLPVLADAERRISRAALLGQAHLLNVWGSWCIGCRQEHQIITEIANSGVIPVYGLNWKDTEADATRWLQQFGDPYVISAFDESGRIGIDFGVYAAPETYLIDAQGIIRYKHLGPLSKEAWDDKFLPLIESMQVSQN